VDEIRSKGPGQIRQQDESRGMFAVLRLALKHEVGYIDW
jgi:hypothetical protein